MNLIGILIGVIAFLSIGVFHPVVIKAEYYFSKRIWPVFAGVGIGLLALSLFLEQVVLSSGSAILGITCLWSIKELFEREREILVVFDLEISVADIHNRVKHDLINCNF